MSYILDALTKSQQARRQGGVPTLTTPQLTGGATRRAPARRVGIALLLLAMAGVLAGVYVFARHAGDMDASREMTAGVRPSASSPGPPPAAAREDSEPAVPPAPSPHPPIDSTHAASARRVAPSSANIRPLAAATSSRNRRPLEQRPRDAGAGTAMASARPPATNPTSSAPFSVPTPTSEERAAIRAAEQRLFPEAAAPARPETLRLLDDLRSLAGRTPPLPPATAAAAATPRVVDAAQASAAREPEPEPVTTSPAAGAPVRERVGRIRDLPSDLKSSLGQLAINVHVYADEPDERMVIINMKRYREGEQLREGPRLDSITPTGALLSYQSHRFLLDAR